ncbi:transmembrane protein 156 isoform X1 [Microcaecilia unicolor]|uniref:Transmembrane protein 156 isoform X1 n=1 Tax=Microcaecilia unicolor TaxID=1415580 RepID=A0A6P7X592_9AMPH|nr:transmembrane protein 156 isoform X1 [Microcaecilia unicolor]XP_030048477.1 transmembrane protein 156 isoform X1 [Microcaecilia unicolor]
MTKAALAKLLTAIIIMFVLCLPELFKTHQEIIVAMTCKDICSSDNITYVLSSFNISFVCFLQQGTQNDTVYLKVYVNQSHATSGNITNLCRKTRNDSQTSSQWFACVSKRSVYTLYQDLKSQALKVKGSLELEAKHIRPLYKHWDFTVSYAKEQRQPLNHVLLEIHIGESAAQNGGTGKESTNFSWGTRVGEDQKGHISISLKLESPVPYAMCTVKIIWLTLISFVFVLALIYITYNVVWRNKKSSAPLQIEYRFSPVTLQEHEYGKSTEPRSAKEVHLPWGKAKQRHSSASSQIKCVLLPISEQDHSACTE